MVAVRSLRGLDSSKVAETLFREAGLKEARPPCSVLEFTDGVGGHLRARLYEASAEAPHVLYFPAEFDTDETLHLLGSGFQSINFSLIAFEYKGTGNSQGDFSFEGVFEEAEYFFKAVKRWMDRQNRKGDLVIMGRSFGSAVALDLALKKQNDVLCLVIESGFDSGRTFLERSGVDASLIPEGEIFGNRGKMALFKKPVLFIHSPRDVIQSLPEVEWLVAESRSKATQFQIAPSGTRQELATQVGELYLEVVQQWVNLRRGVRPPRKRRPIFSQS